MRFAKHTLVSVDQSKGEIERMLVRRLLIKVVLRYEGTDYIFIDDHSSFNYDGADEPSSFWWEEGNGACDCNRSLFIQRHCYENFKEMPCGDEIKLISLEFIGDWKRTEGE